MTGTLLTPRQKTPRQKTFQMPADTIRAIKLELPSESLFSLNPVLKNLSGKTLNYRKVKDGKKDEPYYKELKEEKIVRESYQTITLKSSEIIRKPVLAVKRTTELKKASPFKKNELFNFYITIGRKKVIKPARNVGFKSSKATQIKRNPPAKFEHKTQPWITREKHCY